MRSLFQDILDMDDVKGVLLLGQDGTVLFQEFLRGPVSNLKCLETLVDTEVPKLSKVQELEFLYEDDRIYIRKLAGALLIVWTGVFAPIAMVRLSCDVLGPSIEKTLSSQGRPHLLRAVPSGSWNAQDETGR